MSAATPYIRLSQWGSSHPAELCGGDSALISATYTTITPPSVPTGHSLGNYCLQHAPSGSSGNWVSRSLGTTSGRRTGLGFWFRPGTNPSSGAVGLLSIDDGVASGFMPAWRQADKKIGFYSIGSWSLVGSTTTITFDTAANNWYYMIVTVDSTTTHDVYELSVWAWNSTNLTWDGVDYIRYDAGVALGGTLYIRAGSFNSATGTAVLGNCSLYQNLGPGQYGPVGVSMDTTFPKTKVTDNTNIIMIGAPTNCTFVTGPLTGTADSGGGAPTATTLTDSSAPFVAGHVGGLVTCGAVAGLVASRTTTVLTLTAAGWRNSDGTLGTTPAGGAAYSLDDGEFPKLDTRLLSTTGTSTGAATGPPGTMTDTNANWLANAYAGQTVTCGGKTLAINSNTATVLSAAAGVGWSGGGNPGAAAYSIPYDDMTSSSPASSVIQVTGSPARTDVLQRHKGTQSLITSGKNILGMGVFSRMLTTVLSAATVENYFKLIFRLGTGTELWTAQYQLLVANAWVYDCFATLNTGGSSATGTANAAVTFTATTMTDTRAAWTTNQWAGFLVWAGPDAATPALVNGGSTMLIISNTATTLTGVGWLSTCAQAGQPTDGQAWAIGTGFATGSTDTDQMQFGYTFTKVLTSLSMRIGQVGCTIAYQTDEQAVNPLLLAAGAQII